MFNNYPIHYLLINGILIWIMMFLGDLEKINLYTVQSDYNEKSVILN